MKRTYVEDSGLVHKVRVSNESLIARLTEGLFGQNKTTSWTTTHQMSSEQLVTNLSLHRFLAVQISISQERMKEK